MGIPQRIDAIDIIKGIAIIMIVNVHLISGQFFPIGHTYHVIAFFFSAGLIHGASEKWKQIDLLSFANKRLKQLGYPYCVLSICYMLMHMAINLIRGDSLINVVIINSFLETVSLRGIGTLWFLPVLFLGECMFYGAKRIHLPSLPLVLMGVLFIIIASLLNNSDLLNSLDSIKLSSISLGSSLRILVTSMIASSFIALGHWFYPFFHSVLDSVGFSSSKKLASLIFICIVSFILDFSLIELYCGDLHKLDLTNPLVFIICSLSGLSFVTSLALIIKWTSGTLSSLLGYLGRNSIIIFTTHSEYYLNSVANIIIVSLISLMGIAVPSKGVSCLALMLIIILEVGVVFIVNHSFLRRVFFH